MDPRLTAILKLRTRSEQFANGTLPFEELPRALSWFSFDDEDDEGRWDPRMAVKDLSEELQMEYLFYVKWRGEAAHGSPKSTTWVYGKSIEPYGWIDKQAFHKMFTEEFFRLKLADIPSGE